MDRRSKMNQLPHAPPDGAWAHAMPMIDGTSAINTLGNMAVEEPEKGFAGPSPVVDVQTTLLR